MLCRQTPKLHRKRTPTTHRFLAQLLKQKGRLSLLRRQIQKLYRKSIPATHHFLAHHRFLAQLLELKGHKMTRTPRQYFRITAPPISLHNLVPPLPRDLRTAPCALSHGLQSRSRRVGAALAKSATGPGP